MFGGDEHEHDVLSHFQLRRVEPSEIVVHLVKNLLFGSTIILVSDDCRLRHLFSFLRIALHVYWSQSKMSSRRPLSFSCALHDKTAIGRVIAAERVKRLACGFDLDNVVSCLSPNLLRIHLRAQRR